MCDELQPPSQRENIYRKKKKKSKNKEKSPGLKRQISIENESLYDNFLDKIENLSLLKLANWDETTLFENHKNGFYIKQIFDSVNLVTGENKVFLLKMSFHRGDKKNRSSFEIP